MFSDKNRIAYIGELINEITETKGNTLVLVQYRRHGKILAEYIPEALSLDGRDKDRTKHYKAFNDGDNNTLICTFGIASTGIDIPRIFNLVVLEPGRKFEKVIQVLGRGLRIAKDKTHLGVFDVCGDSGFSKKHAATRRALYKEAKQPLEIIEVDYYDVNSNG
jgi:superfamily II DNA or RNA helicase